MADLLFNYTGQTLKTQSGKTQRHKQEAQKLGDRIFRDTKETKSEHGVRGAFTAAACDLCPRAALMCCGALSPVSRGRTDGPQTWTPPRPSR